MQDPEITKCPTMPAEGYHQGEKTLKTLEVLAAQYPYLGSNKPMNTKWGNK